MLAAFNLWTALGLLVVGAKAFNGPVVHNPHYPFYHTASSRATTCTPEQTTLSPTSTPCYTESTTASTTTVCVSPPETITTSIPTTVSPLCTLIITTYVPTTITTYMPTTITTYVPTTVTDEVPTTVTDEVPMTVTDEVPMTVTDEVPTTITDEVPTTITDEVPTTITDYVPTTITPPPPNPCPTYCSMSVGTVNLFFWPTNEPYTYPSTYVDTHLDYTFTSPSVYMIVNTIFGYNTAGRAGPSGTSVVFALDLDQVSTMVPIESVTRQLTLNDLGTDCPQMEAASVIATAAAGGRCDPILVAPEPVKSWASPCNACGAFGLFDPPYAVPPLQGGLVPGPTMTTMAQPEPQTTTSRVPATESTTTLAVTETTPDVTPIPTLTQLSSTSSVTTSNSVTSSSSSLGADPNPTTTPAMTASATKVAGGRACLILSLFVSIYLL